MIARLIVACGHEIDVSKVDKAAGVAGGDFEEGERSRKKDVANGVK